MHRWIKGWIIGIASGAAGAILAVSPLYMPLERALGLPWLLRMRGPIDPPTGVAVVAIDRQTGPSLDLGELPGDWPRSVHARLIDALVQAGASTIVLDLDLRHPTDPQQDLALARAMADAGRVVLREEPLGARQPIFERQRGQGGPVRGESFQRPLPAFAQAARGLGPDPLDRPPGPVGQFRVFGAGASAAPTMPAVALQVQALGVYPRLLARLKSSGVRAAAELPQRVEAIEGPEGLRRLMLALRGIFVLHPGLPGQLAAGCPEGVSEAEDAGLDPGQLMAALGALYGGPAERHLNLYGPPGTMTTIPYQSVVKGEATDPPPEALDFTGKVVFVGLSGRLGPGQTDPVDTVFRWDDGVDLSRVEIAATAYANLSTDRSLKTLDGWATPAGLFLFGLSVGAILYLLPAIIGVPLAVGLAVLYALAGQWGFARADLWLPVATPLLVQLPFALSFGLITQYLLFGRRVRHISQAISDYLPEDVHLGLAAQRGDSPSLDRVVYSTCLATDMSGFSTVAEQMGPGELARFLNDYFESLAEPLRRHGVAVTEFRADAIMCAWTGDPLDPDVRKRPILAALDAAQAIAEFKNRHRLAGARLRIGMESGEVYVGRAGGGGHFVYSIVGDSANTASRIEGLNRYVGTQILATRSVTAGFDDALQLREIGRFRLLGKTDVLPIVEVLSHQLDATPAMRELCERFAQALDLFQRAEWAKAAERFKLLLGSYPQDGPTGFYLDLCDRYMKGQATSEDPRVVTMSAK